MIASYNEILENINVNGAENLEQYLKAPRIVSNRTLLGIKNSLKEDLEIEVDENYNEVLSFFTGGTSIAWTYAPGGSDSLYGGFRVNGLWDSLVLDSEFWKIEFSLGPDKQVPEHLKKFETINWFERQAFSDDGRFGCFIKEKGVFPPKIAFYDTDWFIPMELSFEEYLNAMFASCAVKGWQYFYVDINKDMPHWQEGFKHMEIAVKYQPTIFPDKDFSYHKQKLEEARIRLAGAR